MDIVDTTVWNGFILVNSLIYTASPFALVFVWAAGGTIVLYYFGYFTPSVEAIRQVYTNYGRRYGAVHEHTEKPPEHVAGRLPPVNMLLTRKMPEQSRRMRSFWEELQLFILEQVSFVYKFAMKKRFEGTHPARKLLAQKGVSAGVDFLICHPSVNL
jgi:hypothetical protein